MCDLSGGPRFDPHGFKQHSSFMEMDYKIFSTAILSLPLIQDVKSVSGKRMCSGTGYPLGGLNLPRKSVVI